MNVRDQIIAFREREGLSQCALARKVGISNVALYKIEKGEYQPSKKTIEKLSKVISFDTHEIIFHPINSLYLKGLQVTKVYFYETVGKNEFSARIVLNHKYMLHYATQKPCGCNSDMMMAVHIPLNDHYRPYKKSHENFTYAIDQVGGLCDKYLNFWGLSELRQVGMNKIKFLEVINNLSSHPKIEIYSMVGNNFKT